MLYQITILDAVPKYKLPGGRLFPSLDRGGSQQRRVARAVAGAGDTARTAAGHVWIIKNLPVTSGKLFDLIGLYWDDIVLSRAQATFTWLTLVIFVEVHHQASRKEEKSLRSDG